MDDHLLIMKDKEDIEYITRKIQEEYEKKSIMCISGNGEDLSFGNEKISAVITTWS